MEQIFHDAGIPKDAYINIFATNDQIEWVIADPRVRGVSLTGSERAGAAVAEIAGRNLKKVVLELGGSDPFIVLGTDDMDATVESAVGARLENTGQACNAAKRFIVVDDLYDDVHGEVQRGADRGQARRPDQRRASRSGRSPPRPRPSGWRTRSSARSTRARRWWPAASHDGNFFETTILTDIKPDNDAYKEEFFGPVASVYRVGSEDEAVKLANDTPFGLGSYVMTNDADQAHARRRQIDAGMVFVNAVGPEGVELPFGGVKRSGFGRELGRFGADEFVNKKMIRIA